LVHRIIAIGAVAELSLLLALPAGGDVIIGQTHFPAGELAFPSTVECVAPSGGCAPGNSLLDFNFEFVTATQALVGHRLDLVAINVDSNDQFRLHFPVPIVNEEGTDLYLGQAEFLATLEQVPEVNDLAIRLPDSTSWQVIPAGLFAHDPLAGVTSVWYADPEVKTEAHKLWFATLDLSSYGLESGAEIPYLDVAGSSLPGSKADLVVVGHFNGCTDSDQDAVCDDQDNCPFRSNPGQEDQGGVATVLDPLGQEPDGIGDVCQCGDLSGDGAVNSYDLFLLRRCRADKGIGCASCPCLASFARCDVAWPQDCSEVDRVVLTRAVSVLATGVTQSCTAAVP
jgi:hypothetical protein